MKELWATVSSDKPLKVSTSGNYRQPLKIAGTEYYHIFDPKTGKPVDVRVLGVTTLDATDTASNALLDGAATAITVLGPGKGAGVCRVPGDRGVGSHRKGRTYRTRYDGGIPRFPERIAGTGAVRAPLSAGTQASANSTW